MSLSIAIAQTTLALRDLLLGALRRDAGWRLTGATARVTTLPEGTDDAGSGARINIALLAVLDNRKARNLPGSTPPLPAVDLRYLLTIHVFSTLHAELVLGAALQALHDQPVLSAAVASNTDDPLELAVMTGKGRTAESQSQIIVEPLTDLSLTGVHLPALMLTVSNVAAERDEGSSSLLLQHP